MPYTSLPPRRLRPAGRRGISTLQDEDGYFTNGRNLDSHDLRTSNLTHGEESPRSHRRRREVSSVRSAPRSRGFDGSEEILDSSTPDSKTRGSRSFSRPSDLRYPEDAYHGHDDDRRGRMRRRLGFRRDSDMSHDRWGDDEDHVDEDASGPADEEDHRHEHARSYFGNLICRFLGDSEEQGRPEYMRRHFSTDSVGEAVPATRRNSVDSGMRNSSRRRTAISRTNSEGSDMYNSDAEPELLDPYDPKATGARTHSYRRRDIEEQMEIGRIHELRRLGKEEEIPQVTIEFNVSSEWYREQFLIHLAEALMTFGAPSHRLEAQLLSASRVLEVEAQFVHIPGLIICVFGSTKKERTSDLIFVKCAGRLDLGNLHRVHRIYREVVHDELSAEEANFILIRMVRSRPIYRRTIRIVFAFFLSALICPLAFGGSIIDMWIAGVTGVFLSVMQVQVAARSEMYAAVYEITVSMLVSFASRGLSAARSSTLFCYTAISSSGIVGILPGFLILCSSLELASKNIVCGSVKMVYALIYTLFLGFALQIGSDLFLVCDKTAKDQLLGLQKRLSTVSIITGTFVSDNTSLNLGLPISGTFTFSNTTSNPVETIEGGCYRNVHYPWYLQPFPWWTQFLIVPVFSILSSMANLQPFWSREMAVMVTISSAAYAANKAADHFIFDRSDVVSAIGAFVVGTLGNLYSRKMNGTAFTAMVTGVLFLVPSGLSAAGGITAQGNAIDIGAAMISVTVGITVGLFMGQALIYMFGSRKKAAVFSF